MKFCLLLITSLSLASLRVGFVDSGYNPNLPELQPYINHSYSYDTETGSLVFEDYANHGTAVVDAFIQEFHYQDPMDVEVIMAAFNNDPFKIPAALKDLLKSGCKIINLSLALAPGKQWKSVINEINSIIDSHPETLFVIAGGQREQINLSDRNWWTLGLTPLYPYHLSLKRHSNVINVGGVIEREILKDVPYTIFSNYGGSIEVYGILNEVMLLSSDGNKEGKTGISFIVPRISAKASLYFQLHPDKNPKDFKKQFLESIEPEPAMCPQCDHKRKEIRIWKDDSISAIR